MIEIDFFSRFQTTLWEKMDTMPRYSTIIHPQKNKQMGCQLDVGTTFERVQIERIQILGMNSWCTYNIHTIKHFILPHKNHLVRLVLATYLSHHLKLYIDSRKMKLSYNEMRRRKAHLWTRSSRYI
jgi:hypothetical protein